MTRQFNNTMKDKLEELIKEAEAELNSIVVTPHKLDEIDKQGIMFWQGRLAAFREILQLIKEEDKLCIMEVLQ